MAAGAGPLCYDRPDCRRLARDQPSRDSDHRARARAVALARATILSPGARERNRAPSAAHQLLPRRPVVLVDAFLRPRGWTQRAHSRRNKPHLPVPHSVALRPARRVAHALAESLVSATGPAGSRPRADAARRPATRGTDHVDSNGHTLQLRRAVLCIPLGLPLRAGRSARRLSQSWNIGRLIWFNGRDLQRLMWRLPMRLSSFGFVLVAVLGAAPSAAQAQNTDSPSCPI